MTTLPLGRHHQQPWWPPLRAIRASMCRSSPVSPSPDHRRDQLGQPLAAGVGGVVVDVASDRGQQRVGAGGVVAPALAGEQRGQFHEAGTRAGVAVLAWREDREQVWRLAFLV